ncbi:ankyrin repeat-containing domain protein [Baffinella frigidus]|nr:ankyrin repeat-containing domain protein [Cryptophyta sp. CCMP2293]
MDADVWYAVYNAIDQFASHNDTGSICSNPSRLDEVKRLLNDKKCQFVNINMSRGTGNNQHRPLEIAVYHQDAELVKILLEGGADPNLRPGSGLTTLMHRLASWTQRSLHPLIIPDDREPIFRLLSDHNADFNAIDYRGRTPLHNIYTLSYMLNSTVTNPTPIGVDTSLETLFIKYGADVSKRTPDGGTALYLAIFTECAERVQFLIDHGADVNERYHLNRTPLHTVVANTDIDGDINSENMVKLLMGNGANADEDDQGYTAADLAYLEGFPSLSTFIDKQFQIRRQRDIAFVMGQHPCLGGGSMVQWLDPELARMVLNRTRMR